MELLETKIEELMPRRILADQRTKIQDALAGTTCVISIGSDMACADAPALNSGISAAFRNAGWQVLNPSFMGLSNAPLCGIGVRCLDPTSPTKCEAAVINALRAADIKFDIQTGRERSPFEATQKIDAEIVITPRVPD